MGAHMVLKSSRAVLAPLALTLFLGGCGAGTQAAPTASPSASVVNARDVLTTPLLSLDGTERTLGDVAGGARYVVIEFFSHHCPCQRAHDKRMIDLHEAYKGRGVAFVLVDAEASATKERDREEAESRKYPFPLLIDRGAKIAERIEAEFATYVAILDTSSGDIVYRGGIDSDHSHLTEDATPYVKNALDDLLSQKRVRKTDTKALGCVLQRS